MKSKVLLLLVLITATIMAALPVTSDATPVAAGVSSGVDGRAGGCQRDTAADVRWVSWIHRLHTGSDPQLPEAAGWLALIADGQPYRSVARVIATAPSPTSATVSRLYQTYLGRTPSQREIGTWAPTVRAHGTARVITAALGSNESFSKAGSSNETWLNQVYELVLGRAPDARGRAYWLGRLDTGTSRELVAAALWATPQSLHRRVDSSYRKILGRAGDPGGIAYWSTVATNEGDEALDAALAATQAGWNRAQATYGAKPSPMPAQCKSVARWVPAAGTIVRTLPALSGRSPLLATLTFDDGPNSIWTPQILEILDRYDVPATFFVVGNQARQHPDLVRRVLAEGHRLAVHTNTHPNLETLGAAAQHREIAGSVDVVNDIVGPGHVKCFRPPYGNRNATTDRIVADLGLATIMWSRDGRDWASPGVDHIVSANLDTRYDGGRAVLLLHDGGLQRAQTVAALPQLIEALKARGYEFVQIC